jgi:hypothetical protein
LTICKISLNYPPLAWNQISTKTGYWGVQLGGGPAGVLAPTEPRGGGGAEGGGGPHDRLDQRL